MVIQELTHFAVFVMMADGLIMFLDILRRAFIYEKEVISKVNTLWDHRIYVVPDAINNFT